MLHSLLLVSCLIAAEPSNGALKSEVRTLTTKLDDESADERRKAEEELIKLGPSIIDLLPAPESQSAEGVKQALLRVRKKLQDELAQASIAGSTVTLHGSLKLSQVLAEIKKQSGNNISAPPQPAGIPAIDPEIKVDFNKTPFWNALDDVLDQTGLSIYPYGQPGILQLVPRGPNDLPRAGRASIVGPLRIEAVRVIAQRGLRTSTPSSLRVSLEVAWEPRLQPIAIKQKMADVKVVDSTGAALPVDNPESEPEAPLPRSGSSALEAVVSLGMPAAGAKEITSLKGTLRVMMLGKVDAFSFGNLLKGKQQAKIAAATVAITDFRKNGDAWEVGVQLQYEDAGDALESHRNWALQNKAYLKGPDGKSIEPDGMETTSRTTNKNGVVDALGVAYVFSLDKDQSPEKMTFVYETPGLIATKDFVYELKGIKLP
jgi:hypothetical protein